MNGQEVFQPKLTDSGKNIDITGRGDDVLRSMESVTKVKNIKFVNKI